MHAKKGTGSLKLTVTERGLEFETELPHTAQGDYLLEGIRRGDFGEVSFGFYVDKDEWMKNEDNTYSRSIISFKVLDEIEEKPDVIVLDPPRDGIHPKALPKIAGYGVKEIVYISCKPTSLVEDIKMFKEYGYEVVKAAAVDQFPGTYHVETVVLMGNKNVKPDAYVDLKLDVEELNKVRNR